MIPRHYIALDKADVEEHITGKRALFLYETLATMSDLLVQAEKTLLEDGIELQRTAQAGTTPEPSSAYHAASPVITDDSDGTRTQKVTTEILHQLLRRAGVGQGGEDYNLTDVARLIHYLTGFSYNTIRQSLSSGSFSRANSAEIRQATELLSKLNVSITIK